MIFPPVISPRMLALFVVSHFIASAFAWNPKTNRYVLELTLSSVILTVCGIITVNWYYFLTTNVINERLIEDLKTVTESNLCRITLVTIWIGGLIGLIRRYRNSPVRRDTYGALATYFISGVLVYFTIMIPIRTETLIRQLIDQSTLHQQPTRHRSQSTPALSRKLPNEPKP